MLPTLTFAVNCHRFSLFLPFLPDRLRRVRGERDPGGLLRRQRGRVGLLVDIPKRAAVHDLNHDGRRVR